MIKPTRSGMTKLGDSYYANDEKRKAQLKERFAVTYHQIGHLHEYERVQLAIELVQVAMGCKIHCNENQAQSNTTMYARYNRRCFRVTK